jgi:hypothetical protein
VAFIVFAFPLLNDAVRDQDRAFAGNWICNADSALNVTFESDGSWVRESQWDLSLRARVRLTALLFDRLQTAVQLASEALGEGRAPRMMVSGMELFVRGPGEASYWDSGASSVVAGERRE